MATSRPSRDVVTNTPEVEIHGAKGCPFAWRVRLAAHVKGVAYEWLPFDVPGPEARSAERNPQRKSPLLVHEDFVLTDSHVIGVYLDEAFDGPPLRPADPRNRARQRLAERELAPLQIHGRREATAEEHARLESALIALPRHLGGTDAWLAGATPGLLDFQVWTGLAMVKRRCFAVLPASGPVSDYWARASAHEAFRATAPAWAREP